MSTEGDAVVVIEDVEELGRAPATSVLQSSSHSSEEPQRGTAHTM